MCLVQSGINHKTRSWVKTLQQVVAGLGTPRFFFFFFLNTGPTVEQRGTTKTRRSQSTRRIIFPVNVLLQLNYYFGVLDVYLNAL